MKYDENEEYLRFKTIEILLVQTELYVDIHCLKQVLKMILLKSLSIQFKTVKVFHLILDQCLL